MTPTSSADLCTVSSDPWAVAAPPTRQRGLSPVVSGGFAWILGSIGPAASLWTIGLRGPAVVVLLLGAVCEGCLLMRRRAVGLALLLVATAAALSITMTTAGRSPALLTVVGVAVAHAALVAWHPLASWPERATTVAALALGPLVLAQVTWYRTIELRVPLTLLAVALLTVELYHRAPAVTSRIDRAVHRTVLGATTLLGRLLIAVVALFLLYLPGLFGRAAMSFRRRQPSPSFFHERTVSLHVIRRDARRPFASTEPTLRARRHLAGALVVIAAAALLAGVWGSGRSPEMLDSKLSTVAATVTTIERAAPRPAPEVGGAAGPPAIDQLAQQERARNTALSERPAFAGVPFADALQSEQQRFRDENLVLSPVGDLGMEDFDGRWTNVAGGERRTLRPRQCDRCPDRTVWFIGGSAAFGVGQRDEFTIASELVRRADRAGVSLTVRNFSVMGLTVVQEAEKIEARLRAGEKAPDLVVFYNGYNDVSATLMSSVVHGIDPDEPAKMDFNDWYAFVEGGLDPRDAGTPDQLGALSAQKYRRVVDAVSHELRAAGTNSLFVFQPDALASPRQYEAARQTWELPESIRSYTDEALTVASSQLAPTVLNLRHSLDDHPRPVFFDLMHSNEEGARLVAERMYPAVAARLGLE